MMEVAELVAALSERMLREHFLPAPQPDDPPRTEEQLRDEQRRGQQIGYKCASIAQEMRTRAGAGFGEQTLVATALFAAIMSELGTNTPAIARESAKFGQAANTIIVAGPTKEASPAS